MRIHWTLFSLCLIMSLGWWGSALAAGPTIDEVWTRHGGARPYYDALIQPTQMDMQGMRRKDPALIRNLPPIQEVKPQQTRRSSRYAPSGPAARAASSTSVSAGATGLPSGQAITARPNAINPGAINPGAISPGVVSPSVIKAVPASPKGSVSGPASGNDLRSPAAGGNGMLGGLQPTQNKDDVFVPPPKVQNGGGATSASTGASTKAAGNGGRTAGAGQTSGSTRADQH